MTVDAIHATNVRKVYQTRRWAGWRHRGADGGGRVDDGAVEALSGVSMTIRPGERVGLLGRNGAGKTTFLKIASTLLTPTSGEVLVFGHDVDRDADRVRPLIAVVPQEGKPFFHLTPREQVYTYLRARGFDRTTAKQRTDEALAQMGIEEVADRLSVTLSGGQRQRTMVATVIATEAPLLFLDEPTIGMDPFARRAVWECLRRLTRKGSTILLTTHYLDEAEALAERLYIVDRGRVLVEGTADALKHRVGGTLRVSVPGGDAVRALFAPFGNCVADAEAVHVITEPAQLNEIMDLALRHGLHATVGPVTLEEAFLRAVGRSIDDEAS
ncbi:MAG: ABC transporter ATP-binding protein [Thermoplasmata archaeon]|nr:ABC transporter ATP-binding protein [Thermoplasmata archaeon]